jgi:hypothetical protein
MEQRAWSAGFLYPAGSYKGMEHGAWSAGFLYPAGSYKGREHGSWSAGIFSRRYLIKAESMEHGAAGYFHGGIL